MEINYYIPNPFSVTRAMPRAPVSGGWTAKRVKAYLISKYFNDVVNWFEERNFEYIMNMCDVETWLKKKPGNRTFRYNHFDYYGGIITFRVNFTEEDEVEFRLRFSDLSEKFSMKKISTEKFSIKKKL